MSSSSFFVRNTCAYKDFLFYTSRLICLTAFFTLAKSSDFLLSALLFFYIFSRPVGSVLNFPSEIKRLDSMLCVGQARGGLVSCAVG